MHRRGKIRNLQTWRMEAALALGALWSLVSECAGGAFWCAWAPPDGTLTLGVAGVQPAAGAAVTVKVTALLPPSPDQGEVQRQQQQQHGQLVPAHHVQLSNSTLQVVVPSTLPKAAYVVSLVQSSPASSFEFECGVPEIWWAQGESGNASLVGGWLRLFGRNLALPPAAQHGRTAAAAERRQAVRAQALAVESQRAANAGAWAELAELAKQQLALAAGQQAAAAAAFDNTTLVLCPVGGHDAASSCHRVPADVSDSNQWHARFWLPTAVGAGEYTVAVSNGFAEREMDAFITPTVYAHLKTHTVKSRAAAAWPEDRTFHVSAFGCSGGFFAGTLDGPDPLTAQGLNCTYNGAPYVCPRDCTAAILAAVHAAGEAGGGVVLLQPGRWYLSERLRLPDNVLLRGSGMAQTGLYFAFYNESQHPGNLISAVHGSMVTDKIYPRVRFGVEDLSIYVLAYYSSVIEISAYTDGVTIRRVRIRANAFTGADWWGSLLPPQHANGARGVPWKFEGGGSNPLIPIHGKNFEISGCDLYGSWTIFKSSGDNTARICGWSAAPGTTPKQELCEPNKTRLDCGPVIGRDEQSCVAHGCCWAPDPARPYDCIAPGGGTPSDIRAGSYEDGDCSYSSARYGLIANNTIANGGACHWFDQAQQIIFENNTCRGNSQMSMGNNIDTYGGGFAQHVYLSSNHISNVWGNDREVLTYDDAGQFAAGHADELSLLNVTLDCSTIIQNGNTRGGAVAIIAGFGAGQIRRIVGSYFGNWSAPAGAAVKCHRSFKLDAPFTLAPDSTSVFQAMPFRGENVFHNMRYSDTGGFQFYGLGMKNIVSGVVGERMGGLLAWGQWRGCRSPTDCGSAGRESPFASNPNLQNEYVGNIILEGLRADHQSAQPGVPKTGSQPGTNMQGFGDGPHGGAHNFITMMDSHPYDNQLIVWRENEADSNGGLRVGSGIGITVEGNVCNGCLPRSMVPTVAPGSTPTAFIVDRDLTEAVWLRHNVQT
eukprot:SAG31_NODE_105_length_25008_cov_17.439399_3_plen_993_part_00